MDQMPRTLCDGRFSFILSAHNCSRHGFSATQL